VKVFALCATLFFALPGFAAISNVQSNAAWTCSGSGSSTGCPVILTTQPTSNGNLLTVWTFWQSATPYIASVQDTQLNGVNKFFPSAVGPTLQSASNTSAQIFYAANITGSGLGHNDTVTVTFTCASTPTICASATITGGVVAVEYMGADQSNPLDSVSAGHSISAGTQFDSGFAAPTSSNVLVFGAGVTDSSYIPSAGSGFSSVQSHTSAITEQNILSGAPSSIPLQHATAVPPAGTPPPNGALSRALFAS
jgi:hypothetical protein